MTLSKTATLFGLVTLLVAACGSDPDPVATTPPTGTVKSGETCSRNGELRCGSGADGKKDGSVLFCSGGKYDSAFTCPGLQECTELQSQTAVRCGTTSVYVDYAKEGAPCGAEGGVVCSFDKATIEWCVDGVWVTAQHCAPSTCTGLVDSATGKRGMGCQSGGITAGDRCKTDVVGGVTCSTDLRSLLACKDGVATQVESCASPKVCTLTSTGRGCF